MKLAALTATLLASLALLAGTASADGSPSSELGGTGGSSTENPLVIPQTEALVGNSEVREAHEVQLTSPVAVAEREASLTKFSGLQSEAADKADAEAFPTVITEPAGGPPRLPAGQSITGYLTDEAATVDLGEGKHGILESVTPIALETSSGQRMPVDLSLSEARGAFEPKTPAIGVRIPKQLSAGVSLERAGVSLTPVGEHGVALGGSEGALDGASVLYANTQTDSDTVVKPTTEGFEADTILRSVDSPQQLLFRVGLPAGASLVQARNGSGAVEVVKEGTTIATVLPPGAQDAAGTTVPTSMSVSSDTLVLSVADHAAEYQYPVEVDPEVTGKDVQLTKEGSKRSNWEFYTGKGNGKNEPSANFASSEEGDILKTYGLHEYQEKEEAFWVYQTRGVSKIYEFEGETEASNKEDHIESIVELQYGEAKTEHGITEAKEELSTESEGTSEYTRKALPKVLCPSGTASCPESAGHEGNAVHFQQSVVNKPTSKFSFSDELDKGTVYISEPEKTHSTASYNTSSEKFEYKVKNSKGEEVTEKRNNALYGTSNWLSEYSGAIQFTAKDPGIGVAKSWLEYESSGKWEAVSGSEHNYLEEGLCKGVQCEAEQKEYWTLNTHLPNGEDKIRYRAEEAFGDATHETESLPTEGVATVKVDDSKPHSIYLGGLPYANELSEKVYKITAYATDGEGSTIRSSGIASVAVFMENSRGEKKEITKTGGTGECSASTGECTASAEYTINGAELGAGHHGIVIVAKDRAGNEGREEEQISVRHSTPVPFGPGSLDLQSGDFTLGPTDVSLGGGLSVSRVYSSRDLTAGGEASLLGPQWSLSMGSNESLVEMVDKSVLVTSGSGSQTVFAAVFNSKGEPTGKFEAPPGDSNLTMTLGENGKKEKAYYLKDPAAGTSTEFLPSSTAKIWVPTAQEGPVPADTVSYFYETVEVGGKKVTRPSEEHGATPAKVSCATKTKMEAGCRALKFTYATKTKSEIGEGPSQWGEYEGRLIKISYEGYNPATKKMTETPIPVAEYAYDKQGRLRAEWDPRLAPHELKTEYGYDSEGHVTALDPSGQEPWVLTYGSIAEDAGAGRLIKATQAPPTTGLWKGEVLENTVKPEVTGLPAVGVRLAVSNGTWSNSLVYGYAWERCNSEGKECAPIGGATNENYTPGSADVWHTLVAVVTATNGGGSLSVATLPTALVYPAAGYRTQKPSTARFNSLSCMLASTTCVGGSESGSAWYATNVSASSLSVNWKLWEKPTEPVEALAAKAVACPSSSLCLLANEQAATGGTINYATSLGGSWTEAMRTGNERSNNVISISCPSNSFCVAGQSSGSFHYSTNPGSTSWKLISGFASAPLRSVFCLTSAFCVTISAENVYVATSEAQIKTAAWTKTAITGTNWFNAITCTSTSACVAVTQEGYAVALKIESNGTAVATKHDIDGTTSLTGVTCPSSSTCVAVDVKGHVFISTNSGETWKTLYSLEDNLTSVSCASSSLCVTGDTAGNITAFNLTGTNPEGAKDSPRPGWTVDYSVPVSGTGAPHSMSTSEVAKWGQKKEEAPVEATAIFPPDSPQGWPASSYSRATISYLDKQGRVVNTATPSAGTYGAITTAEYNETNDVVRTLSADNRVTALKESCESELNCASANLAKMLSTENTYNGEGEKETEVTEPGTRLILSRGPEHTVKYVKGEEHYKAGEPAEEAMARSLTKYFYNEGAPAENPKTKKKEAYDLLTTTQSFAELINKEGKTGEIVDESETKTGYSGQTDLGWQLRAPTSVTAAPGSQNLTTTTEYYESGEAMGKVKETRTPKGSGGKSAHDKQVVYYTAEENKEYPECEKHPEWAGLVCETLPAKQPETTGVPNLPVAKTTYNVWNEPEAVVETFPKSGGFSEHTRTTKDEYDAAGRMTTSEETSTATTEAVDKALPKVTEEYNPTTGALEKQSTTTSGRTKTITNIYNTLGQLESYTDSDGNVAKFYYAPPENGGVLEEMTDGSDEGHSSQKYTYNTTTMRLETLVDSAAGTFTASYDTEGKLTNVVYPNQMCAAYTSNSVGEATHVAYTKTSTCTESEGVWFSEAKTPSIRGEMMSRTSTLASEEYGYDTLGRLTEVHETPTGEYCKTRLYIYDGEANRTKLITREPNSKKECATEGGVIQEHTYDEANRMTDSGITYDPLGNITKLPSVDAEGYALESTFYVDNAAAAQTQNGVTNEYHLDPAGRTRETISGTQKVITHYDGAGEAVAWTCEGSEKAEACESTAKWTRNIPGIDGTLAAVQSGKGATGETPILQLHDLEGDVVGTIKDKAGEAKLESTYNSTEFGAPNGGKEPPKFAWLGAGGVEKSLASGVITEGSTSYVPQTGMALQSEEIAPPGLPDGSGGQAANFTASSWNLQGAERVGAEAPGLEAGREEEAAKAACKANPEACDPEGIMTGLEAKHFAEYWDGEAKHIEDIGATECLESPKAVIYPLCLGAYDAKHAGEIHEDEELADKLEWCYEQVHGRNDVCYFDYGGWYAGGIRAVEHTHVSVCSGAGAKHSGYEWWCGSGVGDGRRWWHWSERGIHGNLWTGHP